jgi:transcription termination factor 2
MIFQANFQLKKPTLDNMTITLYKHQKSAIGRMKDMERNGKGGILADEMGLGKTITMVYYLKRNKIHRMMDLIVCPLSVIPHWEREIDRVYDEEKVNTLVYQGSKRKQKLQDNPSPDFIITTYQIIAKGELAREKWGRVVLDEAHAIKNGLKNRNPPLCAIQAYTLGTRAIFCWCITGTPFNNRMKDIASLCKFIGTQPYSDPEWWNKSDGGKDPIKLARWKARYLLRRTKENLLAPVIRTIRNVIPTEKESKLIDALRKRAKLHFEKWKKAQGLRKIQLQGRILALVIRLRVVADSYFCGEKLPEVDEVMRSNSKVRAILKTLRKGLYEDPSGSVIIFSQFTRFLDILEVVIKKKIKNIIVHKFTGSMKTEEREETIQAFTKGTKKRVLLISLMAGGVGLNLTPCSTVLISEPWYNPFVEKQAEERVHRLGQKNQVRVYNFTMENSVESWMELLKKKKIYLAQELDLINKSDRIKSFSFGDIENLFSEHVRNVKKEEKDIKKKQKKETQRNLDFLNLIEENMKKEKKKSRLPKPRRKRR